MFFKKIIRYIDHQFYVRHPKRCVDDKEITNVNSLLQLENETPTNKILQISRAQYLLIYIFRILYGSYIHFFPKNFTKNLIMCIGPIMFLKL